MPAGRNVEQLFMTPGTVRPPRMARYARAPSRSEPVVIRVPGATGNGSLIGSDVLVREPEIAITAAVSNSRVGPSRVISKAGVFGLFPSSKLAIRNERESAAPDGDTPRWAKPMRPRS